MPAGALTKSEDGKDDASLDLQGPPRLFPVCACPLLLEICTKNIQTHYHGPY